MNKALALIALFALILATTQGFAADESQTLMIVAPDSPPQAMSEPIMGLSGNMVETVLEACKRAGLKCKMNWMPWARGQSEAASGKNMLVTGLSRFPERENLYTWIAPAFVMTRRFLTVKPTKINTYEEAIKKLKHIAVTNGSAQHVHMTKSGFAESQISAQNVHGKELEMLLADHIDGWYQSTVELQWRLKMQPEYAKKVVMGAPLFATDQYIACSKDCDPAIVSKLAKAVKQMTDDGTITKIFKKYE